MVALLFAIIPPAIIFLFFFQIFHTGCFHRRSEGLMVNDKHRRCRN